MYMQWQYIAHNLLVLFFSAPFPFNSDEEGYKQLQRNLTTAEKPRS